MPIVKIIQNKIQKINKNKWYIKSYTDNDIEYEVTLNNKKWTCECNAFKYSEEHPKTCKHISKVKEFMEKDRINNSERINLISL